MKHLALVAPAAGREGGQELRCSPGETLLLQPKPLHYSICWMRERRSKSVKEFARAVNNLISGSNSSTLKTPIFSFLITLYLNSTDLVFQL